MNLYILMPGLIRIPKRRVQMILNKAQTEFLRELFVRGKVLCSSDTYYIAKTIREGLSPYLKLKTYYCPDHDSSYYMLEKDYLKKQEAKRQKRLIYFKERNRRVKNE